MPKHTHMQTVLRHPNGHAYNKLNSVTTRSPSNAINNGIIRSFRWTSYTVKYQNDPDGGTEYFTIKGVIHDGQRLTAKVFSCYCEPLNEDQEPPF